MKNPNWRTQGFGAIPRPAAHAGVKKVGRKRSTLSLAERLARVAEDHHRLPLSTLGRLPPSAPPRLDVFAQT